jgi:MATE family multidrug resistance protein
MAEQDTKLDPSPRSALVELLYLAMPTVAQMASYTLMQFINTWQLSRLGTDEPTATGNAGIISFAIMCFGVGVLFLVNTLVSQHYGRGEYRACGKFLWQGIWFSFVYSMLLFPLLPVFPRMFNVFGHPAQLVRMEASYMRIVTSLMIFQLIATACGQFLLAANRPNSVLLAAFVAVCCNVASAWVMIFGHFGFGPMGVYGAAWATCFGTFVEMGMLLMLVFGSDLRERFNTLDWRFRAREFLLLVRYGAGSGIQILADVLAWSLFMALVMAQLGEATMAANLFTLRYMSVSFMPAYGISQAVTALVGRYIGAGKPDIAVRRAHLAFALGGAYMLGCGVIMTVARYPLIHVFTRDPEVVRVGVVLLIFAGVYQLFDAMYVIYNGALRGAGDTFIPAMVTATLCWSITVAGGYWIAHTWPRIGVIGPWSAASFYGVVSGIFMWRRFHSGLWKQIKLDRFDASNSGLESDTLSNLQLTAEK